MIIINDSVYGRVEVDEPVLIDLINSKPVQRLKGISQYGIPDEYYHKKNYSRFEHSIGVFLLLRKLGADIHEQIAGLLHDVSHTAFSHVVDWAIGDSTKEDFQDNNHLDVIRNSEIPDILRKYNISYEEISNLENFSLLEKEAPSLCADRIDYTLRELNEDGFNTDIFVSNLVNYNGQILFQNPDIARRFAYEYLRLQNEHWAGHQAKVRYYILGSIIKYALEKNIISINDLILYVDLYVLEKLEASSDGFITDNLRLLKNGLEVKESLDNNGILLKKKFRYIDPEIFFNGEIKKISDVFEDYKNILDFEKQNSIIEKRYIYNGISS